MSEHRSFPKPTPRITERMAEQRAAAALWVACCREVDARDRYHCRCCLRRVRRTLSLCADRMEHHHLTPRSIAPSLTHDPRNVILVCLTDHQRLTRHEIVPCQSADHFFTHEGRQYIDA